jgi:hypothetical protein
MNEPDAKSVRAVRVGEVVIELKRSADGGFALSCGGNTFDTAVAAHSTKQRGGASAAGFRNGPRPPGSMAKRV